MRKLSIPYTKDNRILDLITIKELEYIDEIYMPLPYDIMPSGRLYEKDEVENYKSIFDEQLKKAKDIDLKVNLLATKPMLDLDTGVATMIRTVRELERVRKKYNVDKVSIGSLTFLKMHGEYLKQLGYEIELSILANIDSVEKIEQMMIINPFLDSICVGNVMIHELEGLQYIKSKYPKLKLKILVNHMCLTNCASHIEHHNFYSNLIYDIRDMDDMNAWRLASNSRQILPNCKACIFYSSNHQTNPIKESSFVRPEDLYIYDEVIDLFKLSGREHPAEEVIGYIKAFGRRAYEGNFYSICDTPYKINMKIDNSKFPKNYGSIKSNCNHKCYKCNYCDSILNDVREQLTQEG